MNDEEIVAALAEAYRASSYWVGTPESFSRDFLLPVVRLAAEQRAAEVAHETATKWQYGAWIDLPGQVEERLASGQFVTEWLHARAAALTATPNHGTDTT